MPFICKVKNGPGEGGSYAHFSYEKTASIMFESNPRSMTNKLESWLTNPYLSELNLDAACRFNNEHISLKYSLCISLKDAPGIGPSFSPKAT